MKPILLILSLLLCSCAGTKVREGGLVVFETQANAKRLTYRSPAGSSLEVEGLDHSGPTRAGANYIKQVGDVAEKGAKLKGL
jgi:hypothetical protein